MSDWTPEDLDRVGAADELDVSSRRPDGSLRRFVTVWVVRAEDGLYVRSAYGPGSAWYRHVLAAEAGRIRAGGVERDVRFEHIGAGAAAQVAIDAAYREKYARFGESYVNAAVSEDARGCTLRLLPV